MRKPVKAIIWILGIGLVLGWIGVTSPVDRARRENLVVGTWYNSGFKMAHQPIVLHILSNHNYEVESSNYHFRKAGTWTISGFPDRGRLILDSYHLGTDTHSDGKLTVDVVAQTLSDPYGSRFMEHKYVKEGEGPEVELPALEKFVLGGWTNNLKWEDNSHRIYYFMSDHRFGVDFESDGKWRIEGSKILLDWIDEDDGKLCSAEVTVNRAKGTMAEPNGRTLTRIKTTY